jgi:hypothetical protein
MNTPIRSYKTMFRASALLSATALAALSLAGHASAATDQVALDTPVGVGGCPGAPPQPCGKPLALPFTTTQPTAELNFTPNPNSDCPNFTVQANIDGVTPVTLINNIMPLAPGNHTLNLDASCPSGTLTSWGGHVRIDDFDDTQGQAPAATPKQGPTVSAQPGLAGVTFHITDRSGVASQCTYSSEGFTSDSFALPANGSFDLFIPAIREFRTRTGTVTCDNGTSAGTSVQF